MNWERKPTEVENGTDRYVSLPDHTQYKYLIDVQGCGWSARVKFLMFSGRPLFLADRKWREYWYDDIKPYVHFIPVKEDLSDLIQQLDWAESHPEEVQQIALNAQQYAINNLRQENAIDYFSKVILNYSNDKKRIKRPSLIDRFRMLI